MDFSDVDLFPPVEMGGAHSASKSPTHSPLAFGLPKARINEYRRAHRRIKVDRDESAFLSEDNVSKDLLDLVAALRKNKSISPNAKSWDCLIEYILLTKDMVIRMMENNDGLWEAPKGHTTITTVSEKEYDAARKKDPIYKDMTLNTFSNILNMMVGKDVLYEKSKVWNFNYGARAEIYDVILDDTMYPVWDLLIIYHNIMVLRCGTDEEVIKACDTIPTKQRIAQQEFVEALRSKPKKMDYTSSAAAADDSGSEDRSDYESVGDKVPDVLPKYMEYTKTGRVENLLEITLKKWFPGKVVVRRPLDGGTRIVPDFVIEFGTHMVIIECDEKQHKTRAYDIGLEQRASDLADYLHEKKKTAYLIRFNPDTYKDGKTRYAVDDSEWDRRMVTLKAEIDKGSVAKIRGGRSVEYNRLFYDK